MCISYREVLDVEPSARALESLPLNPSLLIQSFPAFGLMKIKR